MIQTLFHATLLATQGHLDLPNQPLRRRLPTICGSACKNDATCSAILNHEEGTQMKQCLQNKLCTQFMECSNIPCMAEYEACAGNKVCEALFPTTKGEPSEAETRACAQDQLCKAILICNKVPLPATIAAVVYRVGAKGTCPAGTTPYLAKSSSDCLRAATAAGFDPATTGDFHASNWGKTVHTDSGTSASYPICHLWNGGGAEWYGLRYVPNGGKVAPFNQYASPICVSVSATTTTTTTTPATTTPKPDPVCKSLGSAPHIFTFKPQVNTSRYFDNLGRYGWQTLYEKNGFKIEAYQAKWFTDRPLAPNRAVRVWNNGILVDKASDGTLSSGAGWTSHEFRSHGSQSETIARKTFSSAGVNLVLRVLKFPFAHVNNSLFGNQVYLYDVDIQTKQISGASGWCIPGYTPPELCGDATAVACPTGFAKIAKYATTKGRDVATCCIATTTTTTTTTTPAPPEKTCISVGDPHVTRFDGIQFNNHELNWHTLYKYGQLEIQVEQARWKTTGEIPAVNRAVRYSTNGGASWDKTIRRGELLDTGASKTFTNPTVHLRLEVDTRFTTATYAEKLFYNVYVTTSAYTGATGQCVDGKSSRRLSDGAIFPSDADVKVTQEQAETACAGLKEQKQNCIYDARVANDPAVTHLIKSGFAKVEETVKTLQAQTITTASTATTTSTPRLRSTTTFSDIPLTTTSSSAVSTTMQCFSALAMLVLLTL